MLRLLHRCAVGAFIFRRASQISFARGGGIKPQYPDGPVSLRGLCGLVLPSAGFPGCHGAAAEASETPPNAPCQAGPPAWLSLVGSRESRPLLPPSASGLTPGPGEVARTPRPTLHLPFVGLPRPFVGLRRGGDRRSMPVPLCRRLHSHRGPVRWLLRAEPHRGDFRDVRGSTGPQRMEQQEVREGC